MRSSPMAYDTDAIRDDLKKRGINAVIPPIQPAPPLPTQLRRACNRPSQNQPRRRHALDQLAHSFLAMLALQPLVTGSNFKRISSLFNTGQETGTNRHASVADPRGRVFASTIASGKGMRRCARKQSKRPRDTQAIGASSPRPPRRLRQSNSRATGRAIAYMCAGSARASPLRHAPRNRCAGASPGCCLCGRARRQGKCI